MIKRVSFRISSILISILSAYARGTFELIRRERERERDREKVHSSPGPYCSHFGSSSRKLPVRKRR